MSSIRSSIRSSIVIEQRIHLAIDGKRFRPTVKHYAELWGIPPKSGKTVGATRGHRTDKPGLIGAHREWTDNQEPA